MLQYNKIQKCDKMYIYKEKKGKLDVNSDDKRHMLNETAGEMKTGCLKINDRWYFSLDIG